MNPGGLLPSPNEPMAVAEKLVGDYLQPVTTAAGAIEQHLTLRRWRGGWMRWYGTHWSERDASEIEGALYRRLANASYENPKANPPLSSWAPNRKKINDLTDALGKGIALLPADVEPPAWLAGSPIETATGTLVSCRNGLLDTGPRELRPHDPRFFNLVSVPFDYDAEADYPQRWLGFLDQLWPSDDASKAALQEWFGYVLSGRTDLQKLFLVVGPPRSGKGTIARVLQALVGRGNHVGPTLAGLGQNFGLQSLIGKPLAIISDARLSGRTDTQVVVERLLSISGEDSLTVDRKYRDPWTGRLPTRLLILSNELPSFGDASGAIATRFVVLQLTRSWLGNEDTGLAGALVDELPGILNWALDGYDRLDAVGHFVEPASSVDAVIAMQDAASPMGAFVRERCEVGAGLQVPVEQFYAAWRGWCLESGRDHPGTIQTVARSLHAVVPAVRTVRRKLPDGTRLREYVGIGLGPRRSATPTIVGQGLAVSHIEITSNGDRGPSRTLADPAPRLDA